MEDLIQILLAIYFGIIPIIYNIMWKEDKGNKSFIKWYFTKSDRVNGLGYFMFFILGLGCSLYILLIYFCNLLFYVVFLPICCLFEFLFLNKDCSHIVCKDLKKYKEEL